jgi:hypothetical protein
LRAQMEEMNKLSIGEPEFFDLKQPILSSPGLTGASNTRRPRQSPRGHGPIPDLGEATRNGRGPPNASVGAAVSMRASRLSLS